MDTNKMPAGETGPNRVQSLIDAASERVGSQNKAAQAIGYTSEEISMWRTGRRKCPVEAQALLADLAGLNAQEVLTYAVIEKHANTPKGEKLLSALGKGLLHTIAGASCAISASADWASSHFIRCIERLNLFRLRAILTR